LGFHALTEFKSKRRKRGSDKLFAYSYEDGFQLTWGANFEYRHLTQLECQRNKMD
jgi:hypothetical protein